MKGAWTALLSIVTWAVVSSAHAQSTPDSTPQPDSGHAASYERARDLFWEATDAYRKADYLRARELFAKAHALEPGAATFRALGFCDFQLKQYVQAMIELRAALTEPRGVKALGSDQQREVAAMIKQVEPFVGRVVLELEPADSALHVDGSLTSERDLWLLRGEHTLLASAPSHHDRTLKLTVAGGDEQHTSLVLSASTSAPSTSNTAPQANAVPVAAHTAPSQAYAPLAQDNRDDDPIDPAAAGRTRGIVGLSIGGAALLTGVVTGSLSILKTRDEEHHCSEGHCPLESRSSLATANTLANVSNVTLIVGGLGVAYGLFELFTLPSSEPQREDSAHLRVDVTGTGLVLHGKM